TPMPVLPLVDIAPLLPARGALIGLDLGTKTIGVAASDPDRRLAAGVETIARRTFTADAARLLALAAERKAAGFVLGLPINMDGSEGPRAQSTRAFARNLARLTELPIALWDERLSTVAVERDLIEADVSRKKRGEGIDQHAAAFILQGALDRLAPLGNESPPAARAKAGTQSDTLKTLSKWPWVPASAGTNEEDALCTDHYAGSARANRSAVSAAEISLVPSITPRGALSRVRANSSATAA